MWACTIAIVWMLLLIDIWTFMRVICSGISTKEEISVGICQLYNGTTCSKYLSNKSVFIPPNFTLEDFEERLRAAYGVIKESNQKMPYYAVASG
ncbi:tyrosine-protein kinase transmembrane receptor Ror-like isoform X1 [Musca domestica]|uniref:Tyrosine-protein kinase transmembrane receptor Ror-like isoform X1 n=1 Tax=Musca domestica TaxID=7370 RepID=A0ABM3VQ73_MUSDO|nr:tyrosine-protein kinase transmembrane receptor Ror-like isoform X1 [Musca domestica]